MKIHQVIRILVEAGIPDHLWPNALPKKSREAHRRNTRSFAGCGPSNDYYVMWHREHSKKVMS